MKVKHLALLSLASLRDPCSVGNEKKTVICTGSRKCITHAWLTHDGPAGACSEYQTTDWGGLGSPGDAVALGEIVDRFWRNKTVVFDGDSIMEEQWAATRCILAALGLAPVDAPMCPPETNGGARADTYVDTCSLSPELPAAATSFYTRVRTVPKSRWSNGGSPRQALFVPRTGTLIVRKGFGEYSPTDFAELLALSDIIISGYGLHYSEQDMSKYASNMRSLAHLAEHAGRARVFLKEVSAQHFQGSGAYASWEQAHPKSAEIGAACSCTPMNATTYTNNHVARQNALLKTLPVKLLPFYDATAKRHDLNVGARCTPGWAICACDCSHSCASADFWRDVFGEWLKLFQDG